MSDLILQHLLDRVCPEKPVCLFCQKAGKYRKCSGFDGFDCEACGEFYELNISNGEIVGLYFSLGEYRLSYQLDYDVLKEVDFELLHCPKNKLTKLTVLCKIPSFYVDFSDKLALKEKLMTYLNFS